MAVLAAPKKTSSAKAKIQSTTLKRRRKIKTKIKNHKLPDAKRRGLRGLSVEEKDQTVGRETEVRVGRSADTALQDRVLPSTSTQPV